MVLFDLRKNLRAKPARSIRCSAAGIASFGQTIQGKSKMRRAGIAILLVLAAACSADLPTVPSQPVDAVPAVLARLTVAPDSVTLAPGGSVTVQVRAYDAQGDSLAVPTLTWTSETSGITVTTDGAIQATTTISASISGGVVRVSSGSVSATVRVAVNVAAVPAPMDSGYVQIVWIGGTPATAVAAAFEAARTRLNGLFLSRNRVTAVNPNLDPDVCLAGTPALNQVVTGIVIFAQVAPIDGAGNILGSSGPCILRTGSSLPIVGSMKFDSVDMAGMVSNGTLNNVVLHEMMHTLGFGTIWGPGLQAEVAAPTGADPRYFGAGAQGEYGALGALDAANGVPVENTGGDGTRGAHWRESVFHNELMTGWADGSMAMSRVTISALRDFGYDVDVNRADPYTLQPVAALAAVRASQPIIEANVAPIGVLGNDGRITPYRGQ